MGVVWASTDGIALCCCPSMMLLLPIRRCAANAAARVSGMDGCAEAVVCARARCCSEVPVWSRCIAFISLRLLPGVVLAETVPELKAKPSWPDERAFCGW